ncbi:hypothetical protein NDU88_010099 [Pleurodeles waltl]|uniref:Uncharacterized protein n=1 Tax=Pleurodeles waltl TaxID=8319 RepID=A0AAV7QZF1_PLEWA|nr:hypothetical protein NDU88_010099 [Pleurodeles waltl]
MGAVRGTTLPRGETDRGTPSEEEEEDAEPRTEGIDQQRIEEASATITERTRGPESSAGADSKEEDANTTHHIPGGTWLFQVRGEALQRRNREEGVKRA